MIKEETKVKVFAAMDKIGMKSLVADWKEEGLAISAEDYVMNADEDICEMAADYYTNNKGGETYDDNGINHKVINALMSVGCDCDWNDSGTLFVYEA